MRILRAKVRSYRVHAETEVAFRPDLTVVHGPNESGKSTLVEAIHRALFLSHKVGGQVRDAMLRHPAGGHPEVEVEFERDGGVWTLWKRFGGGSAGDASLKSPQGKLLTGVEAEERLAQLVGTDPVTSGGGAAKALQERWGHLWVWQGTAGENLLSLPAGPDAYQHGKLVACLQEVGEVSVQSALDQQVVAGVEHRWSKVYTPTGQVKAGSLLKNARDEQASAQAERDRILAQMAEREEAQNRHLEATQRLKEVEAELPKAEARLKVVEVGLRQAHDLKRERDHAMALLEPKRERLKELSHDAQALQTAQDTMAQLAGELGPGQQALAELQTRQSEVLGRRTQLREEKEKQDEALAELRAQAEAAADRSLQARLTLQVHQLERAVEAREQLRKELAALDHRLAALPALGETDVDGLRARVQARDLAQAELRSLAAGVRAIRAGSQVEVDGVELAEGELRQITDAARLTVGDAVELELIPGGGGSAQEVRDRLEEAESRLARDLERLGVGGVDEAVEVLAKRQAMTRERAELVAGSGHHTGVPGEELSQVREELRHLEGDAQLEPLAEVDGALMARRDGEEEASRTRLTEAQAELSQLQKSLDAAQTELDEVGAEIQRQTEALRARESQKISAEKGAQMLLEKHGSSVALQAAVTAMAAEVEAGGKTVVQKEEALAGFQVGALEEESVRIRSRISTLQESREAALSERSWLEGKLVQVAGMDLDLERSQVSLEARTAEVDRLDREAAMLQLLRDLLEEEQNRLSTQFSAPLQRAMEAYLTCLLPQGSTLSLGYEAAKGFHSLTWRRGDGVAWPFDALSGGAREQLMAALRLAMAEVLAGGVREDGEVPESGSLEDRPGLPVVFDDSFVNADPRRMEGVNRMLRRAAERGLQVLVFTCDPTGVAELAPEGMVELVPAGG